MEEKGFNLYKVIIAFSLIAFVVVCASSFYVYHIEHDHEHLEPEIAKAGDLLVDFWESLIGKAPEQIICYRESHRNFYLFFFYLLVVVILLIGWGLYMQRRYNNSIIHKNEEIAKQAATIKHAHDEMVSGLRYAGLIQQAFFPSKAALNTIFPNHTFTFLPKDVVSGDFIWAKQLDKYRITALGDCTGHGIGAGLLSISSIDLLNKFIPLYPDNPAKVLECVGKELRSLLTDPELDDALTLCICVIVDDKLIFSASRQDAYLLQSSGELIELKGSRLGLNRMYEDNTAVFENLIFTLTPNSKLFLFTDGVTDQFGGEKGKKVTKKGLASWIVDQVNNKGLRLSERWQEWKGNYAQVDDMALLEIGV
jgi:serine phosphatase RsbU (regulator of sigma subunit)